MIYFFFAAEVLAFLQVFPGLLGVVEVPTQYSCSWPLKRTHALSGPPPHGHHLGAAREGDPMSKIKQKWGAHSVRADNLVLALHLRTIPSFKRADNDEKGLEQTRKANGASQIESITLNRMAWLCQATQRQQQLLFMLIQICLSVGERRN